MSLDQGNDRLEAIWGHRLLDEGFLGIPNIIVRNYRKLGIEHGEFGFICTILTYKHDVKDPYPTEDKLAAHLNCSVPQIKKWVKSISDKGLVLVGQRKSTDKKTWSSNVYNFRPLIDKALALVGETPLPPTENYEIIYRRNPGIPEVSTELGIPEVSTEPSRPQVSTEGTPEVSTEGTPEVSTNRSFKKQSNKQDDDNARTRDDQNITDRVQSSAEGELHHSNSLPDQQMDSKPRPIDRFGLDDSGVDVVTAMSGLNSPPPANGQAPTPPKLDIPPDKLNEIYEMVEARMTAYTFERTKKPYMLIKNDYVELHSLLYSGVSVGFILASIDYSFQHYPDKRWFTYCAEVTKTLWDRELAKNAPPKQIEWNLPITSTDRHHLEQTRSTSSNRSSQQRVTPSAQPGKYERFYQVYQRDRERQAPPTQESSVQPTAHDFDGHPAIREMINDGGYNLIL